MSKVDVVDKVVPIKAFNKAISDLELLSQYERLAYLNRTSNNLLGWAKILEAWINKLSPDIKDAELDKFDRDLKMIYKMLGTNAKMFKNSDLESSLNNIERRLYRIQRDMGIDNPPKQGDSFYETDENW